MTFFFNIKCNLWSNWIWPRSLPSATPKARCLPTSSPSLVNKTPQNNIANFVFVYLCCCAQHFYHLPSIVVFPHFFKPSTSASLLLLKQLNWSWRLVGLQGKSLNVWSKKYEIYRILFGDLSLSSRVWRLEKLLCLHHWNSALQRHLCICIYNITSRVELIFIIELKHNSKSDHILAFLSLCPSVQHSPLAPAVSSSNP